MLRLTLLHRTSSRPPWMGDIKPHLSCYDRFRLIGICKGRCRFRRLL